MKQEIERALEYLEKRFGIEREIFRDYEFILSGDVWITTKEAGSIPLKTFKRKGIRLVRILKRGMKFTTAGMQVFGRYAKKNVVILKNEEEALKFMKGEDLKLEELPDAEEGQVIVKWGDDILGSALYKGGKLKNQIPKGRRIVGEVKLKRENP